MADSSPANSIIEGTVKFRDGKKWKSRWCVMRKLSPVAANKRRKLSEEVQRAQRDKDLGLAAYFQAKSQKVTLENKKIELENIKLELEIKLLKQKINCD